MNQEAIIICESMYQGNTMRLAKAMAFALNCRVVSAGEALAMDLSQYKAVGLGSGIYFTAHHPLLIEAAERLTPAQQAFVFSTHGAPMVGRYHQAIEKTLKRQGVCLLGGFSTKGYDCTGPFILVNGGNKGRPNERDAGKAIRFVSRILSQYAADLRVVPKCAGAFRSRNARRCMSPRPASPAAKSAPRSVPCGGKCRCSRSRTAKAGSSQPERDLCAPL